MVDLKPMFDREYDEFLTIAIDGYANSLKVNLELEGDIAQKRALDETNKLLPNGLNTDNHKFYSIHYRNEKNNVGEIWVNTAKDSNMAFIFFFYVRESFRKEGIGKAAMVQLENILQQQAAQRIELNVFAKNKAKYLYEELGYKTVSYGMQKRINSEK